MEHGFVPAVQKIKYALGIAAGRALTGPHDLIIDIEPGCNTKCIMCWFFSPLLGNTFSDEYMGRKMSMPEFKRNVDYAKKSGVRRISLIGAGEPLLHPDAVDMVRYVKDNGMMCKLVTNGMLLNDANTKDLSDMGLDELHVSMNSASPETYSKVHSISVEKAEDTMNRIRRHLKVFSGNGRTKVILSHVIMNLNYREVERMVDFALDVSADKIFFKFMSYSIPKLSQLLLDDAQKEELENLIDGIPRGKLESVETNLDELKAFQSKRDDVLRKTPCYMGWLFSKVLIDGMVIPCCDCFETDYKEYGNTNEKTFNDIWTSEAYDSFRSLYDDYDERIKRGFRCFNCQMVTQNMEIDELLRRYGMKKIKTILRRMH